MDTLTLAQFTQQYLSFPRDKYLKTLSKREIS